MVLACVEHPGGDTGDGKKKSIQGGFAFGGVFGEVSQASQEAYLNVREWVHVWVAESYGSLEDRVIVEQAPVLGDLL